LAESTDKTKIFGRPMHNGKIRLKRTLKKKDMVGSICLAQTGASDGFVKMTIKLQGSKM
jgi:hypothetical protein